MSNATKTLYLRSVRVSPGTVVERIQDDLAFDDLYLRFAFVCGIRVCVCTGACILLNRHADANAKRWHRWVEQLFFIEN